LQDVLGDTLTYVTVQVPEDFVEKLVAGLAAVFSDKSLTEVAVDRLLGRAGRLAYIIPTVKPYVGMLWSARAAADRHHDAQQARSSTRMYPTGRFLPAARWLSTLLQPPPGQIWLPLEHVVTEKAVPIDVARAPTVEFDASPWGFGAVLKQGGVPQVFFTGAWSEADAELVGARLGEPDGQTAWEYLTLFLCLLAFGTDTRRTGLVILGDNLASLNLALSLKGHRVLGKTSREIAWRQIRQGWRYMCGHLPAELNDTADALSRMAAPAEKARALPAVLQGVRQMTPPVLMDIWTAGL